MNETTNRSFVRLALLTLAAVYFLILVGGVVRATGSGMGCPDWPKCFGTWVPPTDVSQLPLDYQETYAGHGYKDAEFNVAKTWTEYVNRLVGVAIGLLIFATMISARWFLKSDAPVFWWSLVAFVLVGVNGWLGSVVVSTNLSTWVITLHMLLALVLVGVLIYVVVRAERSPALSRARVLNFAKGDALFVSALAASFAQIVGGTQVRERMDDLLAAGVVPRGEWIAESGLLTLVHRSFSLVLLGCCVVLWRWLRKTSSTAASPGISAGALPSTVPGQWSRCMRSLGYTITVVVVVEVLAGVFLFYFALPPILQPVHLLGAALLVGAIFALWLLWRDGRKKLA